MSLFTEAAQFLTDPANWTGATGIPQRLLEHAGYSALTMAIALVIAVPLGLWVGHTGRGGGAIVGLAGALAEAGSRVLLVDLDPQGHATTGALGLVPARGPATLAGALTGAWAGAVGEPSSRRVTTRRSPARTSASGWKATRTVPGSA